MIFCCLKQEATLDCHNLLITNKLQQVLNSAARVVSGTRKFDRGLRQLMHTELHWLDVPQRVQYKLGVITRRCLCGSAPRYLAACCLPVSTLLSLDNIFVPLPAISWRYRLSHRLSTYGRRAFSVAGLIFLELTAHQKLAWPVIYCCCFWTITKTFLFSEYYCTQCIRGICDDALYKLMFYLLTHSLTYLHSYYKRRIGNVTQAFKWYHFQWSWVTSNPHFKVTIIFNVK